MRDRILTGLTVVVLIACADTTLPDQLPAGGGTAATGATSVGGATLGSQPGADGSGAVAAEASASGGAADAGAPSSAVDGEDASSPPATGARPGMITLGGAPAAGGSTPGAGGNGASSGSTSSSGTTSTSTPSGGTTSAGGTSQSSGGEDPEPEGESTCVPGVDTGDDCDPGVDTEVCERSDRTCECGSDSTWTCTRDNEPTNTGGSSGTGPTGGTSNSGGTSNPPQATGGTLATGGFGAFGAFAGSGASGGTSSGGTSGGSTSTGTDVVIPSTCSEGDKVVSNNGTGTHCGYTYEYWKDSGTGTLTLTSDGFDVNWSGINNLLGRKGVRPGTGNETVTFQADYQPNGNSYLCIYGWTRNPLVEYYIVDSWGNWRPPGGQGQMGTTTSDGGTYDLYRISKTGPSIDGNGSFTQYWSVRTEKRNSGTISVGNHFAAWAGVGMSKGSMYEVSMTVEGYQSSGTASVSFDIQ